MTKTQNLLIYRIVTLTVTVFIIYNGADQFINLWNSEPITNTYEVTLINQIILVFASIYSLWIFNKHLILLFTPFYRLLYTNNHNFKAKYTPLVSVVVPAWNEQAGIYKTLKSIMDSNYEHLEIIVINDGSTDNTHQEIMTCLASKPKHKEIKFNYIKQANKGKANALNMGILHSKGEIILTVDADSFLDKNAIKNLVKYFKNPNVDAVVGNIMISNNKTLLGRAQELEYRVTFLLKKAHAVLNSEYIMGGACTAFRRELFNNLGGFDGTFKTEDLEMTMRCRNAGHKTMYAYDVICYTEGATTMHSLLLQRLRWNYGKILTLLKYKKMFFSFKSIHNKVLCWYNLPMSVINIILTIGEILFIPLLILITVQSKTFLPLLLCILLVLANQIVVDLIDNYKKAFKTCILLPCDWALIILINFIEVVSYFIAFKMIFKKQGLKWQVWTRSGTN